MNKESLIKIKAKNKGFTARSILRNYDEIIKYNNNLNNMNLKYLKGVKILLEEYNFNTISLDSFENMVIEDGLIKIYTRRISKYIRYTIYLYTGNSKNPNNVLLEIIINNNIYHCKVNKLNKKLLKTFYKSVTYNNLTKENEYNR